MMFPCSPSNIDEYCMLILHIELMKILKPEKGYRVLTRDELQESQEDVITRLSCLLSVSKTAAASLLHNYNWNVAKLQDAWFFNEDGVREYVGLSKKGARKAGQGELLVCGICFVFDVRFESCACFCEHSFCNACLGWYVSRAIDDGPACLFLRCPDPSCGAVIGQDVVDLVGSEEGKMKYKEFSIRSYVENNREIRWENNREIKWCPASGCDFAIEYDLKSESYDVSERFDVTCDCLMSFCWNCLGESHSPVKCETVAKWKLEISTELENTYKLVGTSKQCPKCEVPIENKKATMHMICQCKHEFCWICRGSYKDHDYAACSSYRGEAEQEESVDERAAKRAKRWNMRCFHYYERWAANHKARMKALANLNEIKSEKLGGRGELVKEHGMMARGFGFLAEAWEQIVECRRVLKWSYVYGYYMPEEASSKTKLFEYLQGEAAVALERLCDCAENTLKKFSEVEGLAHEFDATRTELVGLTRGTRKYFENFVKGVSNGLSEAEGDPLEP